MEQVTDMTQGKPAKLILSFALPLILTNVGQQLYMVVDSSIVGRGVGLKALAAVGSADWTYWLILWTLILPFFRQKQSPLLQPKEQSSLNYFASAWCALENMLLAATAEGLGTVFHIPVADEVEKIKEIVGAPKDYEFTCLLTMGYPADDAFLPRQKEIKVGERIHVKVW